MRAWLLLLAVLVAEALLMLVVGRATGAYPLALGAMLVLGSITVRLWRFPPPRKPE